MSDADVDHQRELEAVGLLVAGALAPATRRRVEEHLRRCERCRDELVEVAALPALLRRIEASGLAPTPPAPDARSRLAATAQEQLQRTRSRDRNRRALVAAAVLPALLVGSLLLGRAGPAEDAPPMVAMQRVDSSIDVDGSLAAQERPWGTQLIVQMRWAKEATAVLVAVGHDGTEQQAATWTAPAGEQSLCQGAAGLLPGQVARWEVRSAAGAPLLVLRA